MMATFSFSFSPLLLLTTTASTKPHCTTTLASLSSPDPDSPSLKNSDPPSLKNSVWVNPLSSPDHPDPPSFKNSVWVNPSSPRAARLRALSSDARYASLFALAQSLASCAPDDAACAAATLAPLGHTPLEHDAVVLLNNAPSPDAALLALRWFQSKFRPKREALLYNVTLKAAKKGRNWDMAHSLFQEMIHRGLKPDNVTFSTLISCARVCSLPDKAVEWFEKMQEFGCTPDDVTYSVMIDAYGRSGNIDMALTLYDRARKEKWRLDSVTFSTLIKVYSLVGNFDGSLNVYEEMKALKVKPNLVTYSTLLDAMGRAGRPWMVKTLYKEMRDYGLQPNWPIYAALLRAYGRARYPEDALGVYNEMKEKGLTMNVVLYNTLLAMCADIGYVNEAVKLFEEMEMSDDCKPDRWSFSSLITIYSCSGMVSEAEGVLKKMLEAGFDPNIFILTSLIQCYGKVKRTDDVVVTFDLLLDLGIAPDDRFCGCLLNVMTLTPKDELGKLVTCVQTANPELGFLVKLLINEDSDVGVFRSSAKELFGSVSNDVKRAYCNCLIDLCVNLDFLEKACELLDLGIELELYSTVQTKTPTQWSLHLRSLSLGAALTALHIWMNDLSKALDDGSELPPLLGINTGHGKHKYSENGLASVFESHLRELNAPFHEAPDKLGWFLTTKVAATSWLESRRKSKELVTA